MLDFSASIHDLIREIVPRVDDLSNIDPDRILVSATYARTSRKGGLLAYIVPLKFQDGSPVEVRVRGRHAYHWGMLPYVSGGKEILYVIYFVLPRFFNLGLREKLETVIHELYHIHPSCNGDLREFQGRGRLHGDIKAYEKRVSQLTEEFLETSHDRNAYRFLKGTFRATERLYGKIRASHIREPRPHLIKIATSPTRPKRGSGARNRTKKSAKLRRH